MIVAKFIGQSSCGFIHGHKYDLHTSIKKRTETSDKSYLWVFTDSHSAECPYESIEAFLKNWEIIKVS